MNIKTFTISFLALVLTCQALRAQGFCPADVTGDLTANVSDLLAVIANWGPCSLSPCHTDVNGDSITDIADLLGVISEWGSCEPVFELEALGFDGESGAESGGQENIAYCTYRVDSSNPGSALVAGTVICTSCPLTWMNACPNLVNAKFNGVPGAPGAVSTGVNATQIGNGFCQFCPPAAGARRYIRTG